MGDVAEVAEQRAFVAGEDFLVQDIRIVLADRLDEVGDVLVVALVAFELFGQLVFLIVDTAVAEADFGEVLLLTLELPNLVAET